VLFISPYGCGEMFLRLRDVSELCLIARQIEVVDGRFRVFEHSIPQYFASGLQAFSTSYSEGVACDPMRVIRIVVCKMSRDLAHEVPLLSTSVNLHPHFENFW